jgi:multiple sugar transport system substrate-binding protein
MSKTFSDTVNYMITKRAKEFAEKNNIDLKIALIGAKDRYSKLAAAIESGQTPDVCYLNIAHVGEFFAKGLLMDLTALDKKIEKGQGAVFPGIKKLITFKGKQYAIPLWVESQALIYRKDLLKAAGYNNPPKTWNEFRKIAKAITDPRKGIYGAGLGYGRGGGDVEYLVRTIIASFGGSEVSKDGKKVTIYSSATIKAAKYIADISLVDKSTPPSAFVWDDAGNNTSYLSGQSAMIFNAGSIINTLKTDNPELYAKTGVAIVPSGPKGCFPFVNVNTFSIFKNNTKNLKLAQEFISFCMDKDWYGKWVGKGAPLMGPVYQSLSNDPVWQDPMHKPYVPYAERSTHLIGLGFKGEFSAKAGEVYTSYCFGDAFQRIFIDKWAPKKAIKELQTKMEQIYKK